MTALTLCSGGGLAALGMQQAGVTLVGAVEIRPDIAAVYAANLGPHVTVAPLEATDPASWRGVDHLQVSPSCKHASVAATGAGEAPEDGIVADAICRYLDVIRPRTFWLENVEGYARFASYRSIRATLDRLDYWSHATVVNAADVGVAQTRRRLILRAVRGGWMQPFRPLPAPVPWVGWYAAIADLLDTLPPSAFAPWQLARLPAELRESALFSNQQSDDRKGTLLGYGVPYRRTAEPALTLRTGVANIPRAFLLNASMDKWGDGLRHADEPAPTIRTGLNHRSRAFLVDGQNSRSPEKGGLSIYAATAPAMAITAAVGRSPANAPRAWLSTGRVVQLTPRALARFQSIPDSYQLPAKAALACECVGNAVPVLLAQRIQESLQ